MEDYWASLYPPTRENEVCDLPLRPTPRDRVRRTSSVDAEAATAVQAQHMPGQPWRKAFCPVSRMDASSWLATAPRWWRHVMGLTLQGGAFFLLTDC